MPLYDFRCRACGTEFEALVRATEPAPACRACGHADLERLIPQVVVSTEAQTKRAVTSARVKARGAHQDRIEYQREIDSKHHED